MGGVLHGKSLKLVIPPQIPAKLSSLKKAPLTVNIILKNSIQNNTNMNIIIVA